MSDDRKTIKENVKLELYREVAGRCPRCGNSLMTQKKKNLVKLFDVAHIFPHSPTPEEKQILAGVERLSDDADDPLNLIALCKPCHFVFDHPRTREEYESMLALKKRLIQSTAASSLMHQYSLERDLEQLVRDLTLAAPDDAHCEVSYDPKSVHDKLGPRASPLFQREVRRHVQDYYPYIRERFRSMSTVNDPKVQLLLSQVRTFSRACVANSMSTADVYHAVAGWIALRVGDCSPEAATVMASFFVQNCEVLD